MLTTFSFTDQQKGNRENISVSNDSIKIDFPCEKSYDCTGIEFELYPGLYNVSMAGASGSVKKAFFIGGFRNTTDNPCAGGYINGLLILRKKTKFFAHVGGMGTYGVESDHILQGGYNGGGGTDDNTFANTGGGGTDIRAEVDDPYHRIFVAGGGGGSDDQSNGNKLEDNDGNGGAGGELESQSFYINGSLWKGYVANQTYGFSFFTGETGLTNGTKHPNGFSAPKIEKITEAAGAGGGWFGGFSSHYLNGGASGGSSFALTADAEIPSGEIPIFDKDYNVTKSDVYAFTPRHAPFIFTNVQHKRGVWYGNGFITISKLEYTPTAINTYHTKIITINMQFILIALKL